MKLPTLAVSLFTATALGLAPGAAWAQDAQDPRDTQDPSTTRTREQLGSASDGRDLAQLGSAYRELHRAAVDTLQAKARAWQEPSTTRSGDGARADTGRADTGDRAGAVVDAAAGRGRPGASSLSLKEDELLIAACAEGLLAGAPIRGGSSGVGDRRTGRDGGMGDDTDMADGTGSRSAAGEQGRTVGLLLVSALADQRSALGSDDLGSAARGGTTDATGTSDSTRTRGTDGTRTGDQRLASGSTQRLEPGIYAVKHAGDSVWLTDDSGRTVLRTSMGRAGSRSTAGTTGDRGDTGSNDLGERSTGARDGGLLAGTSGADQAWEHVFGAITKEAMTSMGWAKDA